MNIIRLDKIMMQRSLVKSRGQAEEFIKRGDVLVEGKVCSKPGKLFSEDIEIKLLSEISTWVSRGALKLEAAINSWSIPVQDGDWLDVGASTGGFTQVLLHYSAPKVTCVDVGHGQLNEILRNDPRVISFEKTNVRILTNEHLPNPVFGCVVDVSFISLTKVIPFLSTFVQTNGHLIVLVKPQFEVGKQGLNKKGVVTKTDLYPTILEEVKKCATLSQFEYVDELVSPILGGDGNKEFLVYFRRI